MKFTKMQGIGNDYIYINCFLEQIPDPSALSIRLSDRHFGIGGDGIILICPSEKADFRMRMFNSLDGSEGEMCGNGVRCAGKYFYEHGMTDQTHISVETLAGIIRLDLNIKDRHVETVRVDMGPPRLNSCDIPVISDQLPPVGVSLTACGRQFDLTCVSMGNPHAVAFVDDVSSLELEKYGPALENAQVFPNKANIEFIEIIDSATLRMRVWERGSGETLACGTGACASLAAAHLRGQCGRSARVILRGGELFIEWDEKTGHIFMTGPAVTVFEGEI